MITQHYIPGEPQDDENGGGGKAIFFIFLATAVIIGFAMHTKYTAPKPELPQADTDKTS